MARNQKWNDDDRWAYTHERLRAHTIPMRSRYRDRNQAIQESLDDWDDDTFPEEETIEDQ